MVSTLIYRSRALHNFSQPEIEQLAAKAFACNMMLNVTGILLFDGDHFLQVLEGPESAVAAVLHKLTQDPRHDNIVKLLHSSEAKRRFGSWGMYYVNIVDRESQDALRWMPRYHYLHEEDRVAQIVEHFVKGQWKSQKGAQPCAAHEWAMRSIPFPWLTQDESVPSSDYCFAFQPIVDLQKACVSSVEALVRGPGGTSPKDFFAQFGSDEVALHEFDLRSKVKAIALAVQYGCKSDLSINLLPGSLTQVKDSTEFLLAALANGGLSPEQLVVEVTEDEAITNYDEFRSATQKLRSAGIRIAIDDFGAGYAGLSILTEFQPDKLKIDRCLVDGISTNGPKQAIVSAIIDLCRPLGIMVVAEGIETLQEFDWLKRAGVQRFQGYLFARPALGHFGTVNIPVKNN
jgi:blue light- and temperature-responsive anti-repressor